MLKKNKNLTWNIMVRITNKCLWCDKEFKISAWAGLFPCFAAKWCSDRCKNAEATSKKVAKEFAEFFVWQIKGEEIGIIKGYPGYFDKMIKWPEWSPNGKLAPTLINTEDGDLGCDGCRYNDAHHDSGCPHDFRSLSPTDKAKLAMLKKNKNLTWKEIVNQFQIAMEWHQEMAEDNEITLQNMLDILKHCDIRIEGGYKL